MTLAHVSDPAQVQFGPAAWFFLVLVCGLGPLLALRSRAVMAGETLPVPRLRIYLSSALWLGALTWLAWITAWDSHIRLFWPPRIGLREVLIGIVALGLGFLARPLIEKLAPQGRRRVRLLAPRTLAEQAGFTGVVVAASIGEEMIYRGVLFTLLAALTGSWWMAAGLSAVVFGLAHLAYGWRTALVIMAYGLRDQLVVGLTGGLYVAMAVHFAHDLIVGALASRAAARGDA